MDIQRNCWLLVINVQRNEYIEPIISTFHTDELKHCQANNHEVVVVVVVVELTFHQKIKPAAGEYQT